MGTWWKMMMNQTQHSTSGFWGIQWYTPFSIKAMWRHRYRPRICEAMGWMHSKCTSRHGGCTSSTSANESIDGFWAEKIRLHWFKLWGSVVVVIGVRLLADAGSLYANMVKVMSHTTRPCLPTSSTAPQMLRHWFPAMLNEVIRFDGKVANISELWLRHLT